MQISLIQSFGLFFTSFAFVGLTTPLVRKLAIRLQVVDLPSEAHKTHREPVPYLGGVAIVLGVLFTTYAALVWSENSRMIGLASTVLIPAVFMAGVGLIDDIKKLSPWPRFVVQNIVGLVISVVLVATNSFGSPTGSKILDLIISVVWIVGITNSINFFDNVDGGASGTVAISALYLFFLSIQGSQYFIAALSIVLAGSTFGFLLWNKPPARIYMGDAGALFLGLLLASLVVRLDTNPINNFATFSIPILLLAVPIMDTSVAVLSRLKRGISPFQGGKDHLSHRLMRSGLSKRLAVISLWIMTAYFAAIAIAISYAPYQLEGLFSTLGATFWIAFSMWFLKKSDV